MKPLVGVYDLRSMIVNKKDARKNKITIKVYIGIITKMYFTDILHIQRSLWKTTSDPRTQLGSPITLGTFSVKCIIL